MKMLLTILLFLWWVTGIFGCGPHGECGYCKDNADCEEGLHCEAFTDGYHRCVKPNSFC